MKTKFLPPSDPLLYKVAKKIKKGDLKEKWFLDIIKEMNKVAGVEQHNDKTKPLMIGLAAPQIGYSYQIVFVNVAANVERSHTHTNNVFMINPNILKLSTIKQRGVEGCYSTNSEGFDIKGIVARPQKLTVEYMTLDGEKVIKEISGFPAVIVQHEVDHLNGKVFVHHVKQEKDLHVVFHSEFQHYKKNWKRWRRNLAPNTYFKDISKQ